MKRIMLLGAFGLLCLLSPKCAGPQHRALSHHTLEGSPLPYPPPEPSPPWWCIFEPPTYPGCILPVV